MQHVPSLTFAKQTSFRRFLGMGAPLLALHSQPVSEPPVSAVALRSRTAVALACVCAAAGLATIYDTVRTLMAVWRDDDLKSMGMVVPIVAALLILRVWRRLGWETEGTWWGFALLAAAVTLVFIRQQMLLIVLVHNSWSVQLPPLPLVAVVYAASIVLLFGGWRLLREAWFPVLLMWAVIPVPNTFSGLVDLPLQHASATVARAWAHMLGQQLTQDKLRLMFSPDFGMFIAPGCNGIRGAITLGLAALIVSYLYRFRWYVFAPVVAGAVLLGYLFNFLRLCLLVVYYKIALPYPSLHGKAKNADYLIGGCLFVCALLVFFAVANKLRRDPAETLPPLPEEPVHRPTHARSYLLRAAAVLLLAAIFGVDAVRQLRAEHYNKARVAAALPDTVGTWHRVRTWDDTNGTGVVVYTWAEYAGPSTTPGVEAPHVSLGVSPVLGVHDAAACHFSRGEDPTWRGSLSASTPGGLATFSGDMYNNGSTQKLEASTVCEDGSCRQYAVSGNHITLVAARPEGRLPMEGTRGAVPVLLKVESTDVLTPPEVMQPKLLANLNAFLAQANLPQLTEPYSHRR